MFVINSSNFSLSHIKEIVIYKNSSIYTFFNPNFDISIFPS